MKLRQLEAMRAVLARGTTTHAAETIGLTQSAISRLITQLEDEVGLRLFDRRQGRLQITPEGQHFYAIAEKVLAGVDQISDDYSEAVIGRDGAAVGGWRALRRLARCGPWTPEGTSDPP